MMPLPGAVTTESYKNFVRISERVQREEGWSPMGTAPKDGTAVYLRYMWGWVKAQWNDTEDCWTAISKIGRGWSDEENCWKDNMEIGGGKIEGPIYGWRRS